MRSLIHALLFAGLTLCGLQEGYGQKADTADLISVSLRIVGEGTPSYENDAIPGYFALATLWNKQDTTIHFWIMSCSWSVHNWISSSDSIYLWIPVCYRNTPERIDLSARQSVDFYELLKPAGKKPLPKTVKLGFL